MKTLACLLLITGCAVDLDTSTTESDISVSQWSDDQQIPNQASSFQPGVAYFGTKLYAAYATGGGTIHTTSFNGSTWSTPKSLALDVAEYGPALAVFQNKLVMVYHAYAQNFLDMATSTDGSTWTTPVTAGRPLDGSVVRYAPSLAVLDSRLYAAYCVRTADGDRVNVDYFYTMWHPVVSLAVTGECKHVALGARAATDTLDLFVTSYSGDWYMSEALGVSAAGAWPTHLDLSPMRSKKPPSLVSCNGITHLVHGGYSTPEEIWWSYLRSDGTWAPDQKVPDQASSGGAALGCYAGTRTMMVHNGGYPQLWWSQFLQ